MDLAELHVCAASDRGMYEPVVACQATAAQQGLFDIANVLLIGALGIIDIVSSLMLSAVAEWSSWEVKPRDDLSREACSFYLKGAYVCLQDLEWSAC